ncbi:Shikimate dehydrogenase [uncultured Eubacteriales bacterium]|uniref:Shikimate dehydrogenase (NADP(+)) n=1 Tax=uncultured Eubacteriales bacterium TaxID=172733 RepID=A0A212KHB1_9FIRM|nr:Shikimate dehydrogenase [uncultured Eubacteriales bacterium]
MKKLCVIGDPVAHSKSPLIHTAMLKELGLDYVYLHQQVKRGETESWVERARAEGYAGFNATMPHKEALVPLMDELDEDAGMYGSVNTVCMRDGKLYGHNTDGRGFFAALADEGISVAGKNILLLGAGGAAKAVALKLAQQGAGRVTVCNRTVSKAEELCKQDPAVLAPADFSAGTLTRLAEESELLVNCSSLGMEETGGRFEDLSFLEALPSRAAVCDLIYFPAETELLRAARRLGHHTVNGLGMLLWQAIFALEHFTDTRIDGPSMARLLRKTIR